MKVLRIGRLLGWVLFCLGVAMLIPLAISFCYHGEGDRVALLGSALITAGTGAAAVLAGRRVQGEMTVRESFAAVTLSWLLMALFGTLPFVLSGQVPAFTDALFESMSGFTTTGSSILTQPSALSRGVGFWRCFTHFVGGFGIVLFALVILPMMGAGGMSLFRAEAAGPIAEKLTPRLKDTVRILLIVYLSLNVACAALLWLFGMDLYDAVAHSFGTIATGGFSTRDTSIATFASPAIEWVITVFMLLSGINFTLYYILVRKRDWRAVLRDGELRLFLGLFVAATVLIGILLIGELGWEWSRALRASAFQVASLFTTAGFATEDYNLWPSFAGLTLVGLMVVGGMAGSTSGGLKTIRLGMVLAILRKVLRRTLQPQAISPARFGGRTLGNELILDVMALVGFYFCFWGISTLYLAWQGCAFDEAVAGVTACLSNAGPGLGRMGPMGNYAHLGADIKLLLTADMLLGRLEFLTVLVVFSRHFWRR